MKANSPEAIAARREYLRQFPDCQLRQALAGSGDTDGMPVAASTVHHICGRHLEHWCNYASVSEDAHRFIHDQRPTYCRAALLCWKWEQTKAADLFNERAPELKERRHVYAPNAHEHHWDRELLRDAWGKDPVGWLEVARQNSLAGTGEILPGFLCDSILDVLEAH